MGVLLTQKLWKRFVRGANICYFGLPLWCLVSPGSSYTPGSPFCHPDSLFVQSSISFAICRLSNTWSLNLLTSFHLVHSSFCSLLLPLINQILFLFYVKDMVQTVVLMVLLQACTASPTLVISSVKYLVQSI